MKKKDVNQKEKDTEKKIVVRDLFIVYPDPPLEYGESLTEPDQTLSIRQLVERHVRGQIVPIRDGFYDEEGELGAVVNMDKVERAQAAIENKKIISQIKQQLENEQEQQEQQTEQTEIPVSATSSNSNNDTGPMADNADTTEGK